MYTLESLSLHMVDGYLSPSESRCWGRKVGVREGYNGTNKEKRSIIKWEDMISVNLTKSQNCLGHFLQSLSFHKPMRSYGMV